MLRCTATLLLFPLHHAPPRTHNAAWKNSVNESPSGRVVLRTRAPTWQQTSQMIARSVKEVMIPCGIETLWVAGV